MSELVLEISAFFISLFCFVDCLKNRRELYLPFPKGFKKKLQDQHFIYLSLLMTLMISAVTSAMEVFAEKYLRLGSAVPLNVLNETYFLFHTILSFRIV